MKLGVILTILGILGIAQYVYFQFTPLALKYSYVVTPDSAYGQFGLNHITTIATRDWTLGIVGLVIGVVLLILGIVKLRVKYESQTH
jgi:Sec-independent protein secretion pathway component TatC